MEYDYAHAPTMGAFTNSDAFIRALIGPFGSGKSSGCVVEFPYRAQNQEPGPDGIRRSRWAVIRNCFDDQTEILTETRGWQLFKDLVPEDRVATLKNGDELIYERPVYYYAAHHKGEMIGLRSEGVDMLVTPDHRLYVSTGNWGQSSFQKAADVYAKQCGFRLDPGASARAYYYPKSEEWYRRSYDAMVYCVEVSSHVVYVRRNGKAHWSGQTYRQLEDTTIRTFHEWLPPAHFGRMYETDHRYVVKKFANTEFEILFRALDKPEHVKNLLSLDLTGGWVNEAREVPWAIIEALQGRVGRYPSAAQGGCTWSGIWMDTNPPDTDSKFYKFFEEKDWLASFYELLKAGQLPPNVRRPEDYAVIFHQPSGLAPNAENLKNLPQGYYQRLGIGKSEEWRKVYIRGEYGFVSDDKIVFPEYKDELHLNSNIDPVPGIVIERNWDFGLTPAVTLSQAQPNGHWIVFEEMVAESMGVDRFSDRVLEMCSVNFKHRGAPPQFSDIGDPAGESRAQTDEQTCFSILHGKNVNIYGGEQNLAMRLESVRKPLRTLCDDGRPRFQLHPRCKNTRKAFLGGYHYRRLSTTSERYSDDPEKNHPYSDLMDGIEYRAVEHFGSSLTGQIVDDYPQAPRPMAGRSSVTGY